MANSTKLFIVEGKDRDPKIIDAMVRTFFKDKYSAKIILLPAEMNLYMLYNAMDESNGFVLDIVEVVKEIIPGASNILAGIARDEIDEIFLFFDYDIHQTNLPANKDPEIVLREMICFFDNETENGKLYISYPMIEAVYDYMDSSCIPHYECCILRNSFCNYKALATNNNPHASKHFVYNDWSMILKCFSQRLVCLMYPIEINYDYYKSNVTPTEILKYELKQLNIDESSFVLSAIPELLFDYFKKDFWTSHFNNSCYATIHCNRKKRK